MKAFETYAKEARSGVFPDDEHSYKMNLDEAENLSRALKAMEG